jgi:prepilin-type N-terminal cleavage/methylation domain-containing protein
MSKRKGFTLVELLVVIAIIALLMSILMPALARVRNQAKNVLCKSNLKQWGIIFSMYTGDHDDYFHKGWGSGLVQHWMSVLRPYYSNEKKLLFCPMATKPRTEGGSGVTSAWGIFATGDVGWTDAGSYGINSWVCNTPEGEEHHGPPEKYWRTTNVKNAINIPLFLDAWWFDGWAEARDPPNLFEDTYIFGGSAEAMGDFCVNRHDGYIHCLFMDFSVRKASLKCLWTFKWHRTFNTEDYWTTAGGATWETWANYGSGWMKDFKDECQ